MPLRPTGAPAIGDHVFTTPTIEHLPRQILDPGQYWIGLLLNVSSYGYVQ